MMMKVLFQLVTPGCNLFMMTLLQLSTVRPIPLCLLLQLPMMAYKTLIQNILNIILTKHLQGILGTLF